MANQVFQTKVDLYQRIITRHLLNNDVNYVVGQNEYLYPVEEVPHRLIIKDEVITVECLGSSKTEHYVFPINRPDILLEHYTFTSSSVEAAEVTHAKITDNPENGLEITTDAVLLSTDEKEQACGNKIVFFSREILGNGLHETLNNIEQIDGSVPIRFIQDVPRPTSNIQAIEDMHLLESELRGDLQQKQTR